LAGYLQMRLSHYGEYALPAIIIIIIIMSLFISCF